MDNFDVINNSDDQKPNSSISFNDTGGDTRISHSPLSLGGKDKIAPARTKPPAPKPAAVPTAAKKQPKAIDTSGRITNVKTFFTKLHAGAIDFLNEQINTWLEENPNIIVKRTNMVTGEIQGKKTEPNIIIVIWYSEGV